MRLTWLHGWDIGTRAVFIAITPLLIISLSLGYYMTAVRLDDARDALSERGSLLARHLSKISEFDLFVGNKADLQRNAGAVLNEEDVIGVVIRTKDSEVLVQAGVLPATKTADVIVFVEPITLSEVVTDDIERESSFADSSGHPELLGRVEVALSMQEMKMDQTGIILTGAFITLLGMLLSLVLAFVIARSVTTPIRNINRVVERLTSRKLSSRADEESSGELGALEKGINEMAATLENSQLRLLRKVEEATAALQESVAELEEKNIELESARYSAEEATTAKAQFLARMSHEIRTPLNAIAGFSRLLDRTALSAEGYEFTRTINRAAAQLLHVIDDILTFSRLESGAVDLETTAFNLGNCCEDVTAILSGSAHEKGLELVLLIDRNVPAVILGDPVRLSQILVNLVNNAIKFTDEGSVVIHVSCLMLEGSRKLQITVSDTGHGLGEEVAPLFDAFTQGDNSITRRYGGSGLGLSISLRLANIMGGDIKAYSNKDKGAEFRITLPLEGMPGVEEEVPVDASLKRYRILVYEPHPMSRRALRNTLVWLGFDVFSFADGAELEGYLRMPPDGRAPDLLVAAFQKSGFASGYYKRLLDTVRAVFNGAVLVLAGADSWDFPDELVNTEKLVCTSKPIRRDTLYSTLLNLLGAPKPVRATPSETAGTVRWLTGRRILVAEDNEFNQSLIRTLLELRGAQVVVVADGAQAVQAAGEQAYDLLMLDLHMPNTDGIAAARQIRQPGEASADSPIVILTADVFLEMGDDATSGLVDEVLYKPITEERMDAVLGSLLVIPDRGAPPVHADKTGQPAAHGNGPVGQGSGNGGLPQVLDGKLADEVSRLCRLIRSGIETQAMEEAGSLVHQLTGMVGYYGIANIKALVGELRDAVRAGDSQKALAVLAAIESATAK